MTIITVQEIKTRINNGETLNLIDVREPDEREAFNIGGTFLPLGMIMSMQTDAIAELQNEEIVCYCRSGKRSLQAAMMLETIGFKNVKNMDGGVLAWQELGA